MLFFDKSKIKSLKERYNTIEQASPATFFKEKGSKFYGYAFPLSKEEEVKSILEGLKKQHPSAGHFCYAWQLGEETIRFRVNDDGEPNNSAGQPIYGQIRSFDITNILVVVVRYFGGTKLGVGGLKVLSKISDYLRPRGLDLPTNSIYNGFNLLIHKRDSFSTKFSIVDSERGVFQNQEFQYNGLYYFRRCVEINDEIIEENICVKING